MTLGNLRGGGLSKSKVLTVFDVKNTAKFGDIISQTKLSNSYYPYGGTYYEENENGIGTLYVQAITDNTCYVYVYSIENYTATQIKKIEIGYVSSSATFNLNSDKNSNVIVLSNTSDTMSVVYYFTKDTYEVKQISCSLSVRGATAINGYIYITTWCNLSQEYMYKYTETGSLVSTFSNNINALYGSCETQCDSSGNFYLAFSGNTSNTSSYIIQSITSDGTLRWRKSMSNLGVKCGAKLLRVKEDGTSLWCLTGSPYTLLLLDANGEVLQQQQANFEASTFYINNIRWVDGKPFIYMQDIGGKHCYLKDEKLNTIEYFDISSTDGRPCLWLDKSKLVVVRYNNGTYLEFIKPYSEYMKR